MNLESPRVSIEKSSQIVFNFLTDVKNFKPLMPEDTSKFELIDDETFLFALSGMPEIVLKKKTLESPKTIVLGAAGGKIDFSLTAIIEKSIFPPAAPNTMVLGAAGGKIDFSLTAIIESISENKSEVQLKFEGDFNAMMAMMIKRPISKFIETLALNIPKHCN